MSEQKKAHKNIHGKPEISSGHDIAMSSSKWFGAAYFYIVNLGKIPMKELWTKQYATRNLWVGYLIKLVLMILVIYLLFAFQILG